MFCQFFHSWLFCLVALAFQMKARIKNQIAFGFMQLAISIGDIFFSQYN
jgi:hypothetical protein